MPTTRPRVPGWHPDPEDPSSLRHWDGRRWGRERRPRPSWAPPARAATDGPGGGDPGGPGGRPGGAGDGGAPARRRRWWLLALGAAAFAGLVAGIGAWLDTSPELPPRTVDDRTFTATADALCARTLPPLRRDRPQAREETGTAAAFGRRIDRAADGLEAVAGQLRALPVAAADRPEIARWLDDWGAYVAVGRRYADRVRADDDGALEELAAEGSTVSRRIFVFARANGMPNCVM